MPASDTYTLRQVSDLTGLSEFTLRGWELRYKAFAPGRTSTGRRRYTSTDIKRAMFLRELTHRGFRIGEIVKHSNSHLEALLDQADSTKNATESSADVHTETAEDSSVTPEVNKVLKATSLHDWEEIKTQIEGAFQGGRVLKKIHSFVLPLVSEVGRRVSEQKLSIAQEHILSALLKEQIFRLLSQRPKNKSKSRQRFIISAPERDYHEIGILVATLLLKESGFDYLFLGPNLPKKDLCETALRYGATHILLASTISKKEGAKEDLFSYVQFMNKNLPQDVSFWLGGRNTLQFKPELKRNCMVFSSFIELEAELEKMV